MDSVIVTDTVIPLPDRLDTAPADSDGTTQTRTGPAPERHRPRAGHFAWIDLRAVPDAEREAYLQACLHHRVDGVVSDDRDLLATLPPTVRRVLMVQDPTTRAALADVDVVIGEGRAAPPTRDTDGGIHVVVRDAPTLTTACQVVREVDWTVLTFTDPTKIPLEIVIAAAENSGGRTVTTVSDLEDAGIVAIVLEHGSDGVVLAPRSVDDIARLQELVTGEVQRIELVELTVEDIEHIGIGERACIDTCSLLHEDEGVLVGSFSTGLFLSCSETHPLPYMPTRPFRWNAAAVHSYVLGPDNRTRYVSELKAGMPVLAVRSDGSVREVRIGRVKIERRPLISINAHTPDGRLVNLIAQDDWHVRVLGPDASVNNVTELTRGDTLLGYAPTAKRHVGLPITEFCDER